jgi:hypothetical protein
LVQFVEVAAVQEFFQLAPLGCWPKLSSVRQYGLDAVAGSVSEDLVYDRDDVSQILSGPRAGRQHVVIASPCNLDRVRLVFVETQRFSLAGSF